MLNNVAQEEELSAISKPSKGSKFLFKTLKEAALYSLILLLALIHSLAIDPTIMDDAYISFRYAANFADGFGLVLNQGQKVEGYSNLLWTLLMALAYKLNFDLPMASWWLGVACMLLAITTTIKTAQLMSGSRGIGYLAGLALAFSFRFIGASQMGLETSLYAALLALAFLGFFSDYRFSKWLMALALMGLAITRAEGLLLSPLIVVFFLIGSRRDLWKNRRPGKALIIAVAVVGFVGLVELWRLLYYHELLPMSVIAKTDRVDVDFSGKLFAWRSGFNYIITGLGWQDIALLFFSVGLAATTIKLNWRRRGIFYATGLTVLGFGLAIAFSNKGDWMPYFRLFIDYLPILILLFAIGINDWATALYGHSVRIALLAVWIWLTLFTVIQPPSTATYLYTTLLRPNIFTYNEDLIGKVLKQTYQPGDLYATAMLGRVGYYSRPAKLLDMLGLADPTLAKWPKQANVYGKFVTEVVVERNPTAIVHNSIVDLENIVALSKDKYIGVYSPKLYDFRLFVIIRADAAERIGKPFLATFPGELLDATAYLKQLREKYPQG